MQKLLRNTFKVAQTFYRFSAEQNAAPSAAPKDKTVGQAEETPVHLRPYNRAKYEVPSDKLKYSTGYALLDVEPMPRARIMKLCYIILDLMKEIPEEAMYRLYTEEKIKYIMKHTDETEDIRHLEETFGHESIEIFIQALHSEIKLVEHMKGIILKQFDSIVVKPWEARPEDSQLLNFVKQPRHDLKHLKQDKLPREKATFLESGNKQAQQMNESTFEHSKNLFKTNNKKIVTERMLNPFLNLIALYYFKFFLIFEQFRD